MKITEIKAMLQGTPSAEIMAELQQDTRSGVQKLLEAYAKRQEKLQAEQVRFHQLLSYERKYRQEGYQLIAGVDEAGRGPLAGPLAVAAVILPEQVFISGLNDSKQLSAQKREQLYQEIVEKAEAIVVNIVGPAEIDKWNIYEATKQSMARVLLALKPRPQLALIDAMPEQLQEIKTVSLIHGDAKSASIAAASIIAKVTRDRLMLELDAAYPHYGFAGNKGYGSQAHMQALEEFGASKWHRRSFEPVKSMHLTEPGVAENRIMVIK